MKTIVISAAASIAMLLAATSARADSVAYICQAKSLGNGTIKATWNGGACSGYVVRDQNGRVQQRGKLGFDGSGEIVLAPDGKTVVFVHSWPYAGITKHGGYRAYGGRVGSGPPPLYGVAIYRKGKLVKRHLLIDLVDRPRMVTASVSHLRWLLGTPKITRTNISLRTTSFRDVDIDLRTGKLTARDSRAWTSCTAIAYGQIQRTTSGFTMSPAFKAKGAVTKTMKFTAAPTLSIANGYRSVCLVSGKSGWKATRVFSEPMLNALTY